MSCKKIFKIAKKEGFDLSMYIDESYSQDQASCVLSGLRNGIDPTPYCDKEFSLDKMMAIKTVILNKLDYNCLLHCKDDPINISKTLQSIIGIQEPKYEELTINIIMQAVTDIRSININARTHRDLTKKELALIKTKESAKQFFTKGTQKYYWCDSLLSISPDIIKDQLMKEGVW